MSDARQLVDKLWNFCNLLRDDGVSTIDYTEQLTYLLFLKMAHERETRPLNPEKLVPKDCSWQRLLDNDGDQLEVTYRHILETLAKESGTLGVIFRKAQNKIQDPAKLRKLITDFIDKENWSAAGVDIKGDAYEGLLAKGAEDVKSGAGQYFTPRALISAMVDVIQPTVKDTVVDPACGTGGFLLAAYAYASKDAENLTPDEKVHLRDNFVSGVELVDGTARLAAMNMLLHGMGRADGPSPIEVRDALIADPGQRWSVVLANPPFGTKSSVTMIGGDGKKTKDNLEIVRDDFWVTTSNKQLNLILLDFSRIRIVFLMQLQRPLAYQVLPQPAPIALKTIPSWSKSKPSLNPSGPAALYAMNPLSMNEDFVTCKSPHPTSASSPN